MEDLTLKRNKYITSEKELDINIPIGVPVFKTWLCFQFQLPSNVCSGSQQFEPLPLTGKFQVEFPALDLGLVLP